MAYTAQEFEGLTLTVSLKTFAAWSGLRPEYIRAKARAGEIGQFLLGAPGPRAKHRYFKADLAKLCQLKL